MHSGIGSDRWKICIQVALYYLFNCNKKNISWMVRFGGGNLQRFIYSQLLYDTNILFALIHYIIITTHVLPNNLLYLSIYNIMDTTSHNFTNYWWVHYISIPIWTKYHHSLACSIQLHPQPFSLLLNIYQHRLLILKVIDVLIFLFKFGYGNNNNNICPCQGVFEVEGNTL